MSGNWINARCGFIEEENARAGDERGSEAEFLFHAAGELTARVHGALEGVADEADLKARLRRARQREMVRIAFRDLAGWADLAEVTATLS